MFDFELRYEAYFNVKSERLTTQLVKLIESMAKEKALVEFQLETLNKQQENLVQKITHLVQSVQFIDKDFDTSTIRLQFDGGRLVRKKQFPIGHFKTRDLTLMSGEIHEDGTWINFRLKPANFRNNREKQREKKYKQGRRFPKFRQTKRCIINFSQRARMMK